MKPRSGSLPRQRSLMALSSSTSSARGLRLAHERELVVAGHPVTAWRTFFMPGRVRGSKRSQRMIASSPRYSALHAAGLVHGHVGLAHGEEGGPPPARGAELAELVDHQRDRLRRADRVAGREGVALEVGVGDERLAVGGEEQALVVAQREVGQGVPAVAVHQGLGPLAVLLADRVALGERAGRSGRRGSGAPRCRAPPASRGRTRRTGAARRCRARRGRSAR